MRMKSVDDQIHPVRVNQDLPVRASQDRLVRIEKDRPRAAAVARAHAGACAVVNANSNRGGNSPVDASAFTSESTPAETTEVLSPFVQRCEQLLSQHFKVPRLREAQRNVLEILANSAGVLATLPTGAGKTLLYALPALATTSGPVLVICPLISLMRDQVRRMRDAQISCVLFTSDQTEEERKQSYALLFSGKVRLIFVSPERLVLPSFLEALGKVSISMAVVDEAHCVVSWGMGFRPEYSDLGKFLARLRPPKILALTATASRASRKTIRESVFPPGFPVHEIVHSPLASNVFVEVRRVFSEDEKWLSLTSVLRETKFEKAIVYFTKRDQCEKAAVALRKQKIHAVAYHAGLKREERQSVESYLHANANPVVVCATLAFGMGIDISGVSLVAVMGFPSNIEEYFQMIGRAGRRGEAARSVLVWSGSDPKRRYFQFVESFPEVSTVRGSLERLGTCFPGQHSRRFVKMEHLEKLLAGSGKNDEKYRESIVSALRVLKALEVPAYNESYLAVTFAAHTSAESVLLSLPPGVTRRSRFFEALCGFHEGPWRQLKGAQALVPTSALSDEALQSWDKCFEILNHAAGQGALQFVVHDSATMRAGLLFKGTLQAAVADLPKYSAARAQFLESLSQLEKLAQSQYCRLAASEEFFAAKAIQGAARARYSCMQCDLCLQRVNKSSSANPYALFERSLSK